MQKILTATGTLEFNKKLKNIENFFVYENDIQYREGIIDILKNNRNFDYLIIYEKLAGEINFEILIDNIKSINNKINIIFILENKNEFLEKKLINKKIKKIFYLNNFNFDEIIFYLKNNNLLENKKNNYLKNKNKKINKIIIISEINNNYLNLINEKLFDSLKIKNKLIYFNFNNLNKKIKYCKKIIFVVNTEVEDLKKTLEIINFIKNNYFINSIKINILFFENKNKINFKLLKFIFYNYNILGKIKLKNNKLIFNKKILNKLAVNCKKIKRRWKNGFRGNR